MKRWGTTKMRPSPEEVRLRVTLSDQVVRKTSQRPSALTFAQRGSAYDGIEMPSRTRRVLLPSDATDDEIDAFCRALGWTPAGD